MNVNDVKRGLREILKSFKNILDDSAEQVLSEAIAGLESSKELFDERSRQNHDVRVRPQPWGYWIYPEYPLRFRAVKISKINYWVDLYCRVLWNQEGSPPVKQDIHLRVWSDEIDYIYREEWDSTQVHDRIDYHGRVMLRCHFDLANPGQSGPTYHLQYGGSAQDNELCWFPEFVKLPRLPYPPMDLVLACQLVAANFYEDNYLQLRKTPEWKCALRRSQEHLLREYYQSCLQALDNQVDLLQSHLWNHN